MKLADYLPEVPKLAQTLININEQINFLDIMKEIDLVTMNFRRYSESLSLYRHVFF